MDRAVYQLNFSKDHVPAWACPECKKGQLQLIKESLFTRETARSLREHGDEDWEPEWTDHVVSCVFECNNDQCKQPVVCTGSGGVEQVSYVDDYGEWNYDYEEWYVPRFFHPALKLMDVPSSCPDLVKENLIESFALVYSNPGAALNCARIALETLLTELDVKRFAVGGGRKKAINLHQRIGLLSDKYKDQRDMLMAVKWLGNAGSHGGEKPSIADVMLAYEILEHVLAEIYEERTKKLKRLVKSVNKTKGIAKPKSASKRKKKASPKPQVQTEPVSTAEG